MKHVLIVNQSAELYGADKAILELIENFPLGYVPIVVLHEEGPLKILLQKKGIQVITSSVLKIKRGIFTIPYLIQMPFEIIGSIIKIRRALKGVKIDLVHSNAISVFIGAFYSFVFRINHIWHVHEIIEHPNIAAKAYPRIVPFFSDLVVFNSNASYNQFYKFNKSVTKKSVIIHNGQSREIPISEASVVNEIKTKLFKTDTDKLIIGLVGRISRLKGQKILLEAFKTLLVKYPNIHLAYIGSPPDGQHHFLHDLEDLIVRYKLEDHVSITDFQENIWSFYDALDIVVVPSTEPESFGLVATEAMLSNKPVIASDHGGLSEIVVHNTTGLLFEPRNQGDLESKLEILITNPKLAKEMGIAGNKRVKECFSTSRYVSAFENAYKSF